MPSTTRRWIWRISVVDWKALRRHVYQGGEIDDLNIFLTETALTRYLLVLDEAHNKVLYALTKLTFR